VCAFSTHRHGVLIKHHVVGEASIVDELDGLAGLDGNGGGLEDQGACGNVAAREEGVEG